MTAQTITKVTNGIHLEELEKTLEALKNNPQLGKSRFYIHNLWIDGCLNTTGITHFYCAGEYHAHPQAFRLGADEPPSLGGDETAPNPVEHLLNALAGCVTTAMVAHAAVRGIKIRQLESEIEGDIDLRGFLGLAPDVPKGFSAIRVRFKVDTDEKDTEKLKQLAQFSPVYNTLINGTSVDIQVVKK